MQRTIRYLSHPQVEIDPNKDIGSWSLSDLGWARVASLAKSGALIGTRAVISSAETKAIETATPIAKALGCKVEIRQQMHENDRSATGYLPADEFEAVADKFFAHPDTSIRGWETAKAAQIRIVAEVQDCLRIFPHDDILMVGHGGVGTLLFCHLAGVPISRDYDQGRGGGGCFFQFKSLQSHPKFRWMPMEDLCGDDTGPST